MIRVYCYLTDEHAHYLSLSNEDRRKVPNRKAILESLCLLADEDITENRNRRQNSQLLAHVNAVSETYPILEIKPQWVREREGMGSKKSFGMGFGVVDGLQGVRQICGSFKGEFSQWKHLLPVGE